MTSFIAASVCSFPELQQEKSIICFTSKTVLPLVDSDGIDAFAAAAFEDLKRSDGKVVSVMSETLGVGDIGVEIDRATEKDIEMMYLTEKELAKEAENPWTVDQLLSRILNVHVHMKGVKS